MRPGVGRIVPPDYLDDDAGAVWIRLAPSLEARGLLSPDDVDLFGAFCTAVVHHRRAVALVNASSVLIRGGRGTGDVVKHPALQVVRDNATLMAQIGGRFGLTPADRGAIRIPSEAEDGAAAEAASILD